MSDNFKPVMGSRRGTPPVPSTQAIVEEVGRWKEAIAYLRGQDMDNLNLSLKLRYELYVQAQRSASALHNILLQRRGLGISPKDLTLIKQDDDSNMFMRYEVLLGGVGLGTVLLSKTGFTWRALPAPWLDFTEGNVVFASTGRRGNPLPSGTVDHNFGIRIQSAQLDFHARIVHFATGDLADLFSPSERTWLRI